MTQKEYDLSCYRLSQSRETLKSSVVCFDSGFFKDSVNRITSKEEAFEQIETARFALKLVGGVFTWKVCAVESGLLFRYYGGVCCG